MLELILVLAIVIVIAALAAPAVDGTINRQAIVSATDRVRVAMGQARVKAIRTGEVHALFFQRGGQCCLLYTSPSPRDLSTSRMPSSA